MKAHSNRFDFKILIAIQALPLPVLLQGHLSQGRL